MQSFRGAGPQGFRGGGLQGSRPYQGLDTSIHGLVVGHDTPRLPPWALSQLLPTASFLPLCCFSSVVSSLLSREEAPSPSSDPERAMEQQPQAEEFEEKEAFSLTPPDSPDL